MAISRERPHGRPVDRSIRVKPAWNDIVGMLSGIDFVRMVELMIAEQLDLVRVHGIGFLPPVNKF